MLSNTTPPNGNRPLSGHGLRRRKMTRKERVAAAAALVSGALQVKPSRTQAGALFGVSRGQIRRALRAAVA
jgi:hypothetical protein